MKRYEVKFLEKVECMTTLAQRIKEKLEEKGVSAYKLEKRVGLKRSAINNILYGKSKSPSIDTIKSIAEGLNCSIADLLGGNDQSYGDISAEDTDLLHCLSTPLSNKELYFRVLELTGSLLREHDLSLSKKQIVNCIEEIYNYSLKGDIPRIDRHFAEWIIEKYKKLQKTQRGHPLL